MFDQIYLNTFGLVVVVLIGLIFLLDGVFNEQTWKLEDQVFMSGSTLEYMRENCGGREAEYSFDTIVKLAEWHVKWKYPRMIARLPRELAWAFLAEDGAKVHFRHYEVQPLVPLSVFVGWELDLINRMDRGAWVWSEKHSISWHTTRLRHTGTHWERL